MLDLFYYLFCSIGLMTILKYGSILAKPREFICSKSSYLKELFSCSLCLGFWSGAAIAVFIYFVDQSFWSNKLFLFPLFSAVSCWTMDSVLGILSYSEKFIGKKALR